MTARRKSGARRDRCALLVQSLDELRPACLHDVAECCSHQARDPGRGGDEDPLLPHLLHDLGARLRIELRSGEGRGDGFDAGRPGPIEPTEYDLVDLVQVYDRAVRIERGRDLANAAEDVGFVKACRELIDVPHSVKQGQDGGLRTHRCRERLHGRGQVVRFARDDDHIEGGDGNSMSP